MTKTTQRRSYSAQDKLAILRRHLLEQVPVSDLCDQYGLNPTVFYRWQKTLFDGGAVVFERRQDSTQRRLAQQVEALSTRLARKDEVIAEIMADHVRLKKTLGQT
jgi:transposase-like protein